MATGLAVWNAVSGLGCFARVDVRTTFKPQWANHRWQFYLDEVINLLNRRNAGSVEPVLQYDSGADSASRRRAKAVCRCCHRSAFATGSAEFAAPRS